MSKPKPKMSQEASPSLLSPLFEKKPPRAYYPRCQKKAQVEKALLEKSASGKSAFGKKRLYRYTVDPL
ncbi:hypothetical protein L596_012537 [Steinernema carpocapsae]|uniref:Uncharacterized protein n=1 Tax=Steinernema carpocapsae TaxID=34508 RepID=A0A4U5NXH1_STECR|nr:hypothetical protein L596_012533 [Steinernema carpocapsae]TKR88268.1 hypothetical protein L596_012537 [Steinernema carpocapsae]